jgi:hypothetical protein
VYEIFSSYIGKHDVQSTGRILKHENKIVVAYSLVQPITEEEKIHYEDLPPEVVTVQVTEVDHHFFDLNINDPQKPKYVTLGQFKGNLIKWPKKNIELYATSIQSFYRPATHTRVTPSCPSSPSGICTPQNFENACDNRVGVDMAVDKEQSVGETPPYQHEPATKTKPSTSMAPKRDANLYEVGLQS